MSEKESPKLELSTMINDLRAQLVKAQDEGRDESLRFTVEEVEMELDIAVEEHAEVGVAAKFYVLTSKFKALKKEGLTQKLKIKLKPHTEVVDPTSGKEKKVPVDINCEVD